MTALNKQAIDFSQPLETESGESVKYICHDVIEYKCARVCVDIATGIVYSSPYVGLKIRNKEANPRAKLREQIESAADAYRQFDNGWISDMKCGDLSHEYLLFVKEPKNVLALLDELEAAEKRIAELESNETREDGNQFLVVRHPGKIPVIKHCSGDLEEFLRNLIEQDPLVTIDIITHRYYGIGGQWVQDADEYLHMIAAAGIGVKGE